MTRSSASITILLGCLVACGSNAAKPPAAPVADAKQPVAASPNVAVSDELAKQCQLRFASTEQAPTFGFDEAALSRSDRDLLVRIADCLTRGPLHGHGVQLVGRADPRGTDEYNLALGSRRAEIVRSYLEGLGVPAARLSPTTRGDLDATGEDEAGWRRDRRVDLQLLR
jgi:peptidoglycan-associated lipoprotein